MSKCCHTGNPLTFKGGLYGQVILHGSSTLPTKSVRCTAVHVLFIFLEVLFLDNSLVISYRDFIKVFLSVSSLLTDDVISQFSSVDNIKIKLVPLQGACAVDVFE